METMEAQQVLVHNFLENSAHDFGNKTAVIEDGYELSYTFLNSRANRIARWMLQKGVENGDRIAILFENRTEYILCYYATLKTGAVAVPINTDIQAEQLSNLLDLIECKMLIASRRFERLLHQTLNTRANLRSLVIDRPLLDWSDFDVEAFSLQEIINESKNEDDLSLSMPVDSLASIIFTSGSTGPPKGVMLSHKNITANTRSICSYLRLTEEDVQMVVLPFHYVMGKSLLNTHFAVGGTIVINNKFAYPATVINQMLSLGVTGFSGVPSTYAHLLYRSPLKNMASSLTSLRYCSQAGGHMSEHLKRALRAILPDWIQIYIMYGATEASARLSYLDPQYYESKMGSIGKAIPGVTMKVIDKHGNTMPANEVGELTAQGPNIMMGYWQDPEATEAALDHNGYHTGDLGYVDADGFFYVTGRRDNLLKVSGHRINPQDIEDVMLSSGLLSEVAIFGLPDEILGNKLVALVSPIDKAFSLKSLERYCGRNLPPYKRPMAINIVKQLPKKSNGKIDKNKCMTILNNHLSQMGAIS